MLLFRNTFTEYQSSKQFSSVKHGYNAEKEKYMAIEKKGISMDSKLLLDIDLAMNKTKANSRSAFISEAVKKYIAYLNSETAYEVIAPEVERIVDKRVSHFEEHLAKLVYKDAVETAMMMHVMAEVYDIDPARLYQIRGVCIKEVNNLYGRFNFEDAINYVG